MGDLTSTVTAARLECNCSNEEIAAATNKKSAKMKAHPTKPLDVGVEKRDNSSHVPHVGIKFVQERAIAHTKQPFRHGPHCH